MTMYNAMKD